MADFLRGRMPALVVIVGLITVLAWYPPLSSAAPPDPISSSATMDDVSAEVGRRIPSFAGFYVDESTRTVHVLTTSGSSTDASRARDEWASLMGSAAPADMQAARVVVHRVKYRFTTLKAWMDQATSDLFTLNDDVVYVDAQEKDNRLEVAVATTAAESVVKQWAEKTAIPDDALSTRIVPRGEVISLQSYNRPIVGGLRIRNENAGICTMTVNARWSGIQGVLTASHCTKTEGFDIGDFFQPSSPDRIAYEQQEPPPFVGGKCPSGDICKWADVLFAAKYSATSYAQGAVAITPENSVSYNGDNFLIRAETVPAVLQGVAKVGSTTGRTIGTVTNACANFRDNDPNSINYQTLFLCQGIASFLTRGGDSGAPVVRSEIVGGGPHDVAFKGLAWYKISDTSAVFSNPVGIQNAFGGEVYTCVSFVC